MDRVLKQSTVVCESWTNRVARVKCVFLVYRGILKNDDGAVVLRYMGFEWNTKTIFAIRRYVFSRFINVILD